MAHILYDDHLLMRVREICACPPPEVRPWKSLELVSIIDRVTRTAADHRSFYVDFMEGIRDLAEDEDEDRILRQFAQHALTAEPRIHADDADVRDHLTHVTQVFLCGWIILNGSRAFSVSEDREPPPYSWSVGERFERLNRGWMYAALLHDCAYSVEYAKRGQLYELLVKEMFGDCYVAGKAGASNSSEIVKGALLLWKQRGKWLDKKPRNEQLEDLFKQQYQRPDHAVIGGIALWEAAEQMATKDLRETLKCAAVAVACHNFQYLIDAGVSADKWPNSWLRLDIEREPLGYLLHLCDELQEWGRERMDEHFLYRQAVKPFRFARTELTFLQLYEHAGLTIDVRLLRHLHPADRLVRHRIRREHELKIADKTRRLQHLFGPGSHSRLKLRLRVRETVDDERCSNAVLVNWPAQRILASFAQVFRPESQKEDKEKQKQDRRALSNRTAKRVSHEDQMFGIAKGKGFVEVNNLPLRRLVLCAPGGVGKSTVFRSVYHDWTDKGWEVGYCEQLPQQPLPLAFMIEKVLVEKRIGLVLLIDHLDRIVDDESCSFWLNELKNLPSDDRLRVIVACRPEEYERYFQHVLSEKAGWERCRLDPEHSYLFPKNVSQFQDERNRPIPAALERLLGRSGDAYRKIAYWAASMGNRRLIPFPAPADLDLQNWKFRTRLGRKPILETDRNRHIRFAHDCVQDLFSALYIVQSLADIELGKKQEIIQIVRQLESLPRDVPRFVFGLLANKSGSLLTFDARQRAARAFARGLLWDCTIQQWLYDSARLQQARYSLDEFAKLYQSDFEVALIGDKFGGHAAYERFKPNEWRKTLKDAKQAVQCWARAAGHAEKVLLKAKRAGDRSLRLACQWMLAFLADHILLVLTRQGDQGFVNKTRKWAAGLRQRGSLIETAPFTRGWVRSMLGKFADTKNTNDVDTLMRRLYAEFAAALPEAEERKGGQPPRWLDVRLAHLASHIGNYFLNVMFKKDNPLPRADQVPRLKEAIRWFQKSITLRESVLRQMRASLVRSGDVEVFATLCQGYSDNAHQYRGVFEALLGICKGEDNEREIVQLAAKLLSAHRQQEQAWSMARYVRGPSDRLPNMFGTSLPLLVIGEVMTNALQSDLSTYREWLKQELEKGAKKMFDEHAAIAEQHARFKPGFDYPPVDCVALIEKLALRVARR